MPQRSVCRAPTCAQEQMIVRRNAYEIPQKPGDRNLQGSASHNAALN